MSTPERLRAVVLAAGAGTRLAPLTDHRPKALCPIANVPLLDRWLGALAAWGLAGPLRVAVNACYLGEQVVSAVDGRAHVSVEAEALGTAGAVAALRGWVDGDDVLICNADAYLADVDLDALVAGWSRTHPRLLVVENGARHDFGTRGFAGVSLLPWSYVEGLKEAPTGLYEVVWRASERDGDLEFATHAGAFIDCGTPADYLAANLHASGGQSVIGAGATVEGVLERSVVWPGAHVAAGERLVDSIRTDTGVTVTAPR